MHILTLLSNPISSRRPWDRESSFDISSLLSNQSSAEDYEPFFHMGPIEASFQASISCETSVSHVWIWTGRGLQANGCFAVPFAARISAAFGSLFTARSKAIFVL